jgi:hypothetical protein
MVLATILQCAIVCTTNAAPNAAEEWRALFQDMEFLHHQDVTIDGVEYPWDYFNEWTPETQSRYEKLVPLVQRAQEIASMEHCDWELHYDLGYDMTMPHMSQLRDVQRLLRFSMLGEAENGNTHAAIDSMNSLLGVTAHHNTTDILIGSLVTASSFAMASDTEELINVASDVSQLDAVLETVNTFDSFDPFGIRASIGKERDMVMNWLGNSEDPNFGLISDIMQKEVDVSSWDMQAEIENYSKTMTKMEAIFQMTDEDEAILAVKALEKEVGELGNLTFELISPLSKLLETAFQASRDVQEFKELIQLKIETLRSNSSAYFLKAAKAYDSIDVMAREEALASGAVEIIEEPIALAQKAVIMEPTAITLSDLPTTPSWLAPIYSLSIDLVEMGGVEDVALALQIAGHLSQQNRLASSFAAASIVQQVMKTLNQEYSKEDSELLLQATKNIPSSDAFMLVSSTKSDKNRLRKMLDADDEWNPTMEAVLASCMTLRKVDGVFDSWPRLVEALGVPDDNSIVLAGLTENIPDALLLADLDLHENYRTLQQQAKTLPLALRKKLSFPKVR